MSNSEAGKESDEVKQFMMTNNNDDIKVDGAADADVTVRVNAHGDGAMGVDKIAESAFADVELDAGLKADER